MEARINIAGLGPGPCPVAWQCPFQATGPRLARPPPPPLVIKTTRSWERPSVIRGRYGALVRVYLASQGTGEWGKGLIKCFQGYGHRLLNPPRPADFQVLSQEHIYMALFEPVLCGCPLGHPPHCQSCLSILAIPELHTCCHSGVNHRASGLRPPPTTEYGPGWGDRPAVIVGYTRAFHSVEPFLPHKPLHPMPFRIHSLCPPPPPPPLNMAQTQGE